MLDAAREKVWREWTTPEAFADWYGGESGRVPVDSVTMDVRAGGKWSLTMFAGPGEREINWEGTYLEVSEPERLVFTSRTSQAAASTNSSPSSSSSSTTAARRCG